MPPKRPADDDPETTGAKPKNTMIIALIAGGAVLLCCTCGGVGTGGWLLRDKLGFGSAQAKKDDGDKDQIAKEGAKEGNKDDQKPPEKPPLVENRKADFVLSAEQFYKEFDIKDNAQARAKYAGKVLELTGEIQSVRDKKMIFLASNNEMNKKMGSKMPGFGAISCDVLTDYHEVSVNLAQGQKVKVVGKYLRAATFQVQLSECSVTPLEQANVPRVSVEDMAREYETNAKNAKAKYDFMDVIFTGTIDRVEVAPDNSGMIHLKTRTKMQVQILGFPQDMPKMAPGKQIEFRHMHALTAVQGNRIIIMTKSLVKVQ